MGIATRRKPIETQTEPDLDTQIADTRARLIAIADRLTQAAGRRDAKLLDGNPVAVEAAEADTAAVLKEREREERRLALLQDKAAVEARHRNTKAHLDRVERVAGLLENRWAAGVEMAEALEAAVKAFRQIKSINASIAASWSFPLSDLQPSFIGDAVSQSVKAELYRLSGDGMGNRGLFPGAHAPSLADPRPTSVKPLIEVLRDSTDYALRKMREAPVPIIAAEMPPAPAVAPVVEVGSATSEQTIPEPLPTNEVRAPLIYAYQVDMRHAETKATQTVDIVFSEEDLLATAHDRLGPLGPLGREIALRVAEERLGPEFTFVDEPNALRFDMKRLQDSINA